MSRTTDWHPTAKARQLALAYWIEEQIEAGRVRDYAAVARALGISRARITQVMDLMLLPTPEKERLLGVGPQERAACVVR